MKKMWIFRNLRNNIIVLSTNFKSFNVMLLYRSGSRYNRWVHVILHMLKGTKYYSILERVKVRKK